MWIWTFGIIFGLIICAVFYVVNKILSKAIAPKTPTLSTPLVAFKESGAVDSIVSKNGLKVIDNISERYERMCILEPLKYVDDPSLPVVIDQYSKLLRGEIRDPEGRHMPSEMLNGRRNLDYERYIQAQKKGSKGLARESRRLKTAIAEEDLRNDLVLQLAKLGLPVEVLDSVLDDEKLNKFSPDNWKDLISKVKEYLIEYPVEYVVEFLNNFHDIKTLTDEVSIDAFCTFRKYDAPMPVVKEIVRGRITIDQGIRIVQLVMTQKYRWDEAMEEVLSEDIQVSKAEELRDKYRAMVS